MLRSSPASIGIAVSSMVDSATESYAQPSVFLLPVAASGLTSDPEIGRQTLSSPQASPSATTDRSVDWFNEGSACLSLVPLGHRQTSYKCPLNGTKKRKRKPRKNTTKNWIPKELRATSSQPINEDQDTTATSSQHINEAQDTTATSPPNMVKVLVKKITPKKKKLDISTHSEL